MALTAVERTRNWRARKRLSDPDFRKRHAEYTARYRLAHPGQAAAYQRQRRQDTRAYLMALKLDRGCADCGYKAHPAPLEFDHVPERGPMKFRISSGHQHPWAEVLAEIEKCDVVCANCHAIRTAERRKV